MLCASMAGSALMLSPAVAADLSGDILDPSDLADRRHQGRKLRLDGLYLSAVLFVRLGRQ